MNQFNEVKCITEKNAKPFNLDRKYIDEPYQQYLHSPPKHMIRCMKISRKKK